MLLIDWLENYYEGKFKISSNEEIFDIMVSAGWIDWFCDTKELPTRMEKLTDILIRITNTDLLENYTVTFYNNCPLDGDLYDEIKIEHKTEDKGGFLKIDSPYKDKKYDFISYYDLDHCDKGEYNLGKVSTYKTDNLNEMIDFLNKINLG